MSAQGTVTADAGSAAPEKTQARRRVKAPGYSMALPAWFWFVFFFVVPVGLILWYSFGQQVDAFTQKPDVSNPSLDNYVKAIDPAYFPTFWRTVRISVIGTVACLFISIPFAYWLATKVNERYRGLLLGLVLVPFWTNFLVRTIGWQIILAPAGFVSGWWESLPFTDGPLDILYTSKGVQLGVIYNYLPLMILPLYVAFERMDPALREASRDLGAGRFKTFMQVTMPLAMPGAVAGMLLVYIPLMGDYITPVLLGGADGSMAGMLVANQFLATFNWSLGAAMAVLLILFILGTLVIFGALGLLARWFLRSRRRVQLPGGAQ